MWVLLLSSFDCDFDSSGFNCDLGYKFRESKQEILHLRIFWINGEREGVQSVEMQGKESSSQGEMQKVKEKAENPPFLFFFSISFPLFLTRYRVGVGLPRNFHSCSFEPRNSNLINQELKLICPLNTKVSLKRI